LFAVGGFGRVVVVVVDDVVVEVVVVEVVLVLVVVVVGGFGRVVVVVVVVVVGGNVVVVVVVGGNVVVVVVVGGAAASNACKALTLPPVTTFWSRETSGSTEFNIASFTSRWVSSGYLDHINPAIPATTGAAMDVPVL